MNDLHIPSLSIDTAIPVPPDGGSRTLLYAKRSLYGFFVVLIAVTAARLLVNHGKAERLSAHNAAQLQRTVLITRATPGELTRNVSLPTTLRGNNETSIHARSNGYLAAWHKGIGDRVARGELLATIDAPEQEQELAQLQAAQQQSQVRVELARQTLQRWESLRLRDGVTQQELEEKRSALQQADADLSAAKANVQRLQQLKKFRRIAAPFSGVITRRNVEVGELISANGKELFALTQTDPLRLSIWVPQVYAGDVKIGTVVAVQLNEFPNTPFSATVERIAGAIDAQTRARQVDIVLANPDARLLPGAYAEVGIELSSGVPALIAPASVLKSMDSGFHVAVLDSESRITYRAVKLGRDLGREVEILDGITAEDTLIVSPSDLLSEGERVNSLAWEGKAVRADKPAKSGSPGNSTNPTSATPVKSPAAQAPTAAKPA